MEFISLVVHRSNLDKLITLNTAQLLKFKKNRKKPKKTEKILLKLCLGFKLIYQEIQEKSKKWPTLYEYPFMPTRPKINFDQLSIDY
jgi:hypothetical protein